MSIESCYIFICFFLPRLSFRFIKFLCYKTELFVNLFNLDLEYPTLRIQLETNVIDCVPVPVSPDIDIRNTFPTTTTQQTSSPHCLCLAINFFNVLHQVFATWKCKDVVSAALRRSRCSESLKVCQWPAGHRAWGYLRDRISGLLSRPKTNINTHFI